MSDTYSLNNPAVLFNPLNRQYLRASFRDGLYSLCVKGTKYSRAAVYNSSAPSKSPSLSNLTA